MLISIYIFLYLNRLEILKKNVNPSDAIDRCCQLMNSVLAGECTDQHWVCNSFIFTNIFAKIHILIIIIIKYISFKLYYIL